MSQPPGDPALFNLADFFVDRHLREGRATRPALRCGDRVHTYGDLAADINRAGNGLLQLGLQKEQRVLLVLPDCPEFAVAYFAVMKIGAVAVPTTTFARTADYSHFLSESEARILIVHSTVFAEIAPVLSEQCELRHVVVVGERHTGHICWDDWLAKNPPELSPAETRANDIAFWLWTSGSTGRPKAAVHLHRDWIHCCKNYAVEVLAINPDDITFSSSKLFHAYGLGNALMFPFYVGASTVLFPHKAHAKAVLDVAQQTRPTLFFSVPTLYAQMLQEAEKESYCLDSIRLAVSAAEPLPAEIFRRFHAKFGIEILDGIGSTEVLHIYISARPGDVRPGSTGKAVPGYQLRLVDLDDREVPPGAIGDLLVAGESIATCYWQRPELTAERMRGKWFFTGDKYSIDADGYYWYAGRSDDMFRVSGQWVSPAEVESALIEHPCVLEAAVVAYREETELLTPKAFVVLRDNVAATPNLARELQDFVKQRITPYKYPRHIQFIDKLPKTPAGKLLRYQLRDAASAPPDRYNKPTMIDRDEPRNKAGLVKVSFPLEPGQWPQLEAENMWAEPVSPAEYRLENVPFYMYGVSAGDIVDAGFRDGVLTFTGIAERSGHSTYRLLLADGIDTSDSRFLSQWSLLQALGCTFEGANKRWLAVDVPPSADIHKIYELLDEGLRQGIWTSDEGHCGHRSTSDSG